MSWSIRIRIPLVADRQVRFRKIGTRRAQAISKVVLALSWVSPTLDGPWQAVRLGLGSVAERPDSGGRDRGGPGGPAANQRHGR